jgi:hypothetical protein
VTAASGHQEADGPSPCADCGTALVGDFCHACGQTGHIHRNLMALVHDLAHGVFHFEGKIWRTLPMLALRPGELTRQYVLGRRTRYVTPVALFLFSVFLLFAAMSWISMADMTGLTKGLGKASSTLSAQATHRQATLAALEKERAAALARDPKADVTRLDDDIDQARLDLEALTNMKTKVLPQLQSGAPQPATPPAADEHHSGLGLRLDRIRENPALYAYKVKMASYKLSWALIPLSVPLIWLLFCFRRDVGLYDHAIFAIYSLSFMTLMVVVLIGLYVVGVPQIALWAAFLFIPPVHMYRQLKGAYQLGRFGAAWRTFALLLMTGLAASVFLTGLLILEAA